MPVPTVPAMISTQDPRITRFHPTSRLLHDPLYSSSTSTLDEHIHTHDQEVYGEPSAPVAFRIGNGGAGYTGVLRALSEAYLSTANLKSTPLSAAIAWVPNHSRHSQIALLADVVQVALTYEPEAEAISVAEGWAVRVGTVFHDHFILVGPDVALDVDVDDEADVPEGGEGVSEWRDGGAARVMRAIAASHASNGTTADGWKFHTRGDGSATFTKERNLWAAAGVDVATAPWVETISGTPGEALRRAERDGAFLLSDRASYLTLKQEGAISSLRVHVEGGAELLNPCSAMVKVEGLAAGDEEGALRNAAAHQFAQWLLQDSAQQLIRSYGRDWRTGKPLFTGADQEEFPSVDRL